MSKCGVIYGDETGAVAAREAAHVAAHCIALVRSGILYRYASVSIMDASTDHATGSRELPLTDLRAQLPELVNQAAYADEAVYVTRHGKRAAAIVPAWVLEELEAAEDQADLEAVDYAHAHGEWIDWDGAKRDLAS